MKGGKMKEKKSLRTVERQKAKKGGRLEKIEKEIRRLTRKYNSDLKKLERRVHLAEGHCALYREM